MIDQAVSVLSRKISGSEKDRYRQNQKIIKIKSSRLSLNFWQENYSLCQGNFREPNFDTKK